MQEDEFTGLRRQMVETIALHARFACETLGRDELDRGVLDAVARVPRHRFVPVEIRAYAYADGPLPIGYYNTISQPFFASFITDLLLFFATYHVLFLCTFLFYHPAFLSSLSSPLLFSSPFLSPFPFLPRRT